MSEGMAILCEDVTVEKDEPLKLELAAFADCARHGLRPRVGGREAAAALDLAMRITHLIELGQAQGQAAPTLAPASLPAFHALLQP